MRIKYNQKQENAIGNFFTKLLVEKYICPSIMAIFILFTVAILGFTYLSNFFFQYSTIGFVYILCINVLLSISSISIYHTIKTCLFGYKQITNGQYTVIQLTCLKKYKKGCSYKCILSDKREYRLYYKKLYNKIKENDTCDLVIISNEHGAKMWEVVVQSNYKNN